MVKNSVMHLENGKMPVAAPESVGIASASIQAFFDAIKEPHIRVKIASMPLTFIFCVVVEGYSTKAFEPLMKLKHPHLTQRDCCL